MLRGLCRQATRRRRTFCNQQALYPEYEPTFLADADCNRWHHDTAKTPLTPTFTCHHNAIFLKCFGIDRCTQKSSSFLDASNVHHASLQRPSRTYASSSSVEEPRSPVNEERGQKDECSQHEKHEEMVDEDVSPLIRELRQAHQELIVRMKRCSYVLLAVGAVHIVWGGVMFFALEMPLNHAVLTEVCMSTLVISGLAYQLRQTVKPVQIFTKILQYQHMDTIFLSRQITRMLGAFFHRGRGIAFVLSLTIGAHALSCIRFLL